MKRAIALILVCCIVFCLAACGSAPEKKEEYISIGTGSVSGVYYPLGGAISSLITEKIDGYNCAAESTGGAVENATLIINGDLDLGFVAASTLYDAQHGLNSFEGMDGENCVALFSFFPEVVQILSTNKDIKTVEDLRGKRVAIGQSGSGTAVMAEAVLKLYGMSLNDVKADNLGFGDAVSGLKDNTIDAAFTWAGIPTASVMELGATHGISMISFSNEKMSEFSSMFTYCVPYTITKDDYSSLYEDAQSFSIPAIICCSKDLPEEFVYDFMTMIFDNVSVLAQTHDRGGDLSLETALNGLGDATLHPGAIRFFTEKGLL